MTLSIQGLRKTFGDHVAVKELSLTLQKGEVLGLLGRNGAGKTTTIKMILGLLKPNGGHIQWEGETLNREKIQIGYLPEERGLYPKSKVWEQLFYFGKLEGMKKKELHERIDFWLKRFDIEEYRNKLAGELSKGNQQKVQLIITLLHNPDLIILDEPFSGLDPVNATMLSEVITELIQQKKTIILSSHRMEQIELFCQNIIMMKKGETVVQGTINEVKESYGYKNLTINTFVPLYKEIQENLAEGQVEGTTFKQKVKSEKEASAILNEIKQKQEIKTFTLLEPTLHEIFVERVN